jgi:hypothetical protein
MRYQVLAVVAAMAVAGSANAVVVTGYSPVPYWPSATTVTSFTPGGSSPDAGFTVIDTFDDLSGVIVNGGTVQVQTVNDGNGAPPANALPLGTSFLSVLGGGSATINFAPDTVAF